MAATDKRLGVLHAAVTEVLIKALDPDPNDDNEIVISGNAIGAAIAFLKNNNVTAEVTENKGLQALEQKLAARGAKLTPKDLQAAADEFAESNKGMMQ